ncbi:Putative DNA repair helicase RadD [Acaryochloris thomasi RCC1774]|uniref:DNA 3'-5' helicase n=1 Tax=Acaryochloris thomasi RCC1774 TaxID=1764569 RepID=A0A2W1JST0_9CYAN|nr:DEAD/DEAH box helicase family protein [Acaryochloris thomasi]PZD72954.1 Putative DNA repair helicase RadD [Acaryochloris thomasi RCC1774]
MARNPTLTYDRGTLILHPPPRGKDWLDFATWDDRIEKFRVPAIEYRALKDAIATSDPRLIDQAKAYNTLELFQGLEMTPYPHQQEALAAWQQAQKQGVVVLPTAAGKTYLAQMAIQATQRSTLIVVPTLDLMHQWYAHLEAAFPNTEVGLLGGGSRDRTPLLVATYNSAAIQAENLGNLYGLMVFDECHHLPSDFNRVIAEGAIAPYRLGLTATPDRSDGRHEDLAQLIGPEIYRKSPEELSGLALAQHKIIQIQVKLSTQERQDYEKLIHLRNQFLQKNKIYLGSLQGWQNFVRESARSKSGRRAMLAHRKAKSIAFGTEGKLRVLIDLLAQHDQQQTLIFTDDNATVYQISQNFLIPAITHQTPVKERHDILQRFRSGEYPRIVASRVLNEGVDVPAASVAIVLSGTGSAREYIQRLGRILRKGEGPNKLALLYEVIAEDTSEEGTSRRRRQTQKISQPPTSVSPLYPQGIQKAPRAADNRNNSPPTAIPAEEGKELGSNNDQP